MLSPGSRRQSGFSLIVALIALVIMSLAAVGLMRTVSTGTLIAGNLAYEQAAVTSADAGVEAAAAWLENNSGQASSSGAATCAATTGSTVLSCDQKARGYLATRIVPGGVLNWPDQWKALVDAGATPATPPAQPAKDAAGNAVAYLIQRMCSTEGDSATGNGCSSAPSSLECGSSKTLGSNAGAGNLACASPTYYRITVRVAGPRSTTSFIQVMVAL